VLFIQSYTKQVVHACKSRIATLREASRPGGL